MVVAYAHGLGSRWMALPADLRGVVAGRIWDRCGPRMGRDDFRPCAYPQVRALHLISGCSIGYSEKRPQHDSNLRTRLRNGLLCAPSACGNAVSAGAWAAYGPWPVRARLHRRPGPPRPDTWPEGPAARW